MAGTIKGILVEIGGDTSGLQKAISKVNTATSSLSKELRGVNSLLKLDPKNTELVSQKQKILAENIEATSQKLEELRKVEEMANSERNKVSDENYRNLQREIANTEYKLKQLQVQASKWTKAGENLEEFSKTVTRVSEKIDKLGSTLTTGLTLPIFAIGTAATTVGNEFEAKMSKVQAIAGATKEELEKLTETAIELGSKTSFSSSQVAEGMENLASAGFNTNEIIKSMPGLLDLAASSGTDLARAAEITASAIRGFGLEANTSAHIADVFAEAAARTNAQTEDMGEAMKYVAPVAKTVGLSIEETAAAIGIMSDAGVKGSQAGTTLRGGLTRIVKPTKVVKEAMEELGVEFYNSNGTMKSLTEIIQTLQEHTKGLTDETKNQALAQIFGTEALSGMLALVNRGSSELESMTKSFKECDGAAAEMAETMLDNTAGSLESLSGSFESAGIAIQKALSPQIRDLAKWIQGLVDDFTELSEEEQQNIVKNALLVASIGPAVKILGKLGKGFGTVAKGAGVFSKAIALTGKTTTQAFKDASSATQILAKGLTFLTSPVGLVTVAITTLVGGLTYLALKQTDAQKKAKEFAEEMSNEKQAFEDYNQSIDKTTSSNLAQINSIERLKNELLTLVDANGKVKEGYEGRVSFILNELNKALGTEYKLNGNIIGQYKELQSEIDTTIQKKRAEIILNGLQEKYANAVNEEETAVKNLTTARENLLSVQNEYGMTLDELRNKASNSSGKEKEYLDNVIQAYDDAIQVLKNNYQTQKQYADNYALFMEGKYNEIGENIKNTTSNWTNSSLETIENSIKEQAKALENYKAIYAETGSQVAKTQKEQAEKNLDALIQELTSRTSTITSMSAGEITAWRTTGIECYQKYSEAISKMEPDMQQKIQNMTGIVASNMTLPDSIKGLASKSTGYFQTLLEFERVSADELSGATETINNNKSLFLATENIAEESSKKFEEYINLQNGKNATTDYMNGAENGINRKKKSFWDLLFGIGRQGNQRMRDGLGDGSPSVLAERALVDYFLGADNGIEKQGNKTIRNIQDYAKKMNTQFNKTMINENFNTNGISRAMSSRIMNTNKTVFTTPQIVFNVQQLDEKNLDKCFNYVNKKFGSKY